MYIKNIKKQEKMDYGFKYMNGYVFDNNLLSSNNCESSKKSEFYVIYGSDQGIIYEYKLQKFMIENNVTCVMLLQEKSGYVYLTPFKLSNGVGNDERFNNAKKAFSGHFLWSNNSEFIEKISNYPIPIHDLQV